MTRNRHDRQDTRILGEIARDAKKLRNERVRRLHGEGLPSWVIGERLGLSAEAVNNIVRKLGLPVRRGDEWMP